jgi:hypothetical protein
MADQGCQLTIVQEAIIQKCGNLFIDFSNAISSSNESFSAWEWPSTELLAGRSLSVDGMFSCATNSEGFVSFIASLWFRVGIAPNGRLNHAPTARTCTFSSPDLALFCITYGSAMPGVFLARKLS